MASAGWRQMLRRYVDAHFQSHAADKIFDVVAHSYDRWDEKSDSFLTNDSEALRGHQASKGRDTDHQRKGEIAGELLADSQIAAPTIRLANRHVTCSLSQRRQQRSGVTYLYYFNATGVGHDLLTYVFGAPLSPGIDPFHSAGYSDADRQMAVDIIKRFSNFFYRG